MEVRVEDLDTLTLSELGRRRTDELDKKYSSIQIVCPSSNRSHKLVENRGIDESIIDALHLHGPAWTIVLHTT